ncbi:unnamed protein product [Calypogeia fissa]
MAKLVAELPTKFCSPPSIRASFHSPPKACRASCVASNASLLLRGIGSGLRWKERRRGKQKDAMHERPGICFYYCWSSVGLEVISLSRRGWDGSFQGFKGMDHGESSRKFLRKKVIRCSSKAVDTLNDDERFTREAQDAVARVLLEAGLSLEDAEDVVSKAPVYIREVAQFVAKLEAEVLAAGGEEEVDTGVWRDFERGDRLYQLVKQGRAMSPFLESLGVNLPSISRISSSFASQRLPDLLSKVRYFEQLVKESEPNDRPVGGLVQVMMKNFSISVWEDEDIQRTLSFFEKIKHQEGGMGALDKTKSALPLFIEAFPQIFNRNLENEIKPTIRFLEDLGITGSKLRKVILCFPPIILKDPERDLVLRKRALKKVGIRVEDMGRMVAKYPWLLSKCVVANVNKLVPYLESIKVPKSKIDRIITKYPHLLGSSCAEALMPMVRHINGYGLTSKRLGRAIAQSPELLLHSPEEFDTVVAFLESVGVEANDISKLLRRSPEILGYEIDSTLQKKISVLEDLGVRRTKLGRIIWFFPEILSMSVESALMPRIKCFRDWGFSGSEISQMIFRFPPLLGYNDETVISPKLEFLTKNMGRSIRDVVVYPRYFSYSLEKKIKPRARVLQNRRIQCDLQTMLAKSDDRFAAEFLGFESVFIPTIDK